MSFKCTGPIHISEFSPKIQRYIELISNAAYDNDGYAKAKIAAMVLYKNKPIAIGFNSAKSHTLQRKYCKHEEAIYVHAEIDAIRKALNHITVEDFTKCTMIIIRSLKNKEWGMAKPCHKNGAGCQTAIDTFGFKTVYYSTNETGFLEEL